MTQHTTWQCDEVHCKTTTQGPSLPVGWLIIHEGSHPQTVIFGEFCSHKCAAKAIAEIARIRTLPPKAQATALRQHINKVRKRIGAAPLTKAQFDAVTKQPGPLHVPESAA